MIKAITFDLWDTVFIDESDEPKRKAAGRLPKKEERRYLVHNCAGKYKDISPELVNYIYDTVDAAYKKVWKDQHVTWTVTERLGIIFKGIGVELPPDEMIEIVRLHEEMELEFRPDFIPGVGDALKELHGKYKLGVISDTIFSPGRVLRQLLDGEGLLQYFDHFVFSDEIGRAKPEPIVFESACTNLRVKPHELAHVGDRESNDIAGPKKFGMKAILCTASVDRGSDKTQADAIFKEYRELPQIIELLNK